MRNFSLIALARAIVIACQFVNIKLFTNYLTASQIGLYFFFLTISYFCNALIFIPVDYYQQANLKKTIDDTGGIFPLLTFNLMLIGYFFIALIPIVVIVLLTASQFLSHVILAATLAVALYATQALRNTLNNLDYKAAVSFNFVQEAVLKIITFILLVKYFEPNELLLMISWLVALIVSVITLFINAKKNRLFVCVKKQPVQAKEVFNFAYPITVGAIANWIQTQGYRLILVPLGYVEILGIFATVTSIGSAGMGAVSTIFSQAFSPKIYKSGGGYTGEYLKNALATIAVIILGCLIFGHLIVKIATNHKYEPYWGILIIGVLIEAGNFLIGAFSIHVSLVGRTKQMMMSSFWGVLILFLSFALIYMASTINVFSIGIPLVLAQLAVLIFIYRSYLKCKSV